jgi:hypothetical protein
VLDEGVDAFGEDGLEVRLTGTATGVGRHHAGDGSVGAEEGTEFGGGFELSGEDGLFPGGLGYGMIAEKEAEGAHLEHR